MSNLLYLKTTLLIIQAINAKPNGGSMKSLMLALITAFFSNVGLASEVKIIKAKVQLYAGKSTDVITHLEIDLRNAAIRACGSGSNISGVIDYKIKIGVLSNSPGTLKIDLDSPDFSGAFIWSNEYPNGEATAKVICKSNI